MTDTTEPPILPEVITFGALRDTVIEAVGFDLGHPYVEDCWLPVLGPTAVLLLRHVGRHVTPEAPYPVLSLELAHALGLSGDRISLAVLARTLGRIERYGFGRWLTWTGGARTFGVYVAVPPLPARRWRRVPAMAQAAHARHLQERTAALAHEAAVAHP